MIFIIFDKPAVIRQLILQPASPDFPKYDVKILTPNYALITTFGADPPAGLLDIYSKD